MKWQPIETAPRNKRFLGFRPPYNDEFDWYSIAVCKYRKSVGGKMRIYCDLDGGEYYNNWTHWMRLPDPPADTEQG